jgi:hypothetical protein
MRNSSVAEIVNALRDVLKYGPCSGPGIAINITAEAGINEAGEVTVAADHLGGLITEFPASGPITISTTANIAIIACGDRRSRPPRSRGLTDDAEAAEARSTAEIALLFLQLTAMICDFSSDCLDLEAADAGTPLVLKDERGKFGIPTALQTDTSS